MKVVSATLMMSTGEEQTYKVGEGKLELIWHPTYSGSLVGFGMDIAGGGVIVVPWHNIAVAAYEFESEA
jgi:hypothetical protein